MVADQQINLLGKFDMERRAANTGIPILQPSLANGFASYFNCVAPIDAINVRGARLQAIDTQSSETATQIGHDVAGNHRARNRLLIETCALM